MNDEQLLIQTLQGWFTPAKEGEPPIERVTVYRPRFRQITGSVLGALILQQIWFYSSKSGGKPFYKFLEPCKKHPRYQPGDSWTEHLGCSAEEFHTALDKFAQKVVHGTKKGDAYLNNLVIYWTNSDRMTFYHLNLGRFAYAIREAYADVLLTKPDLSAYLETWGPTVTRQADNPRLSEDEGSSDYLYSESTPESTAERLSRPPASGVTGSQEKEVPPASSSSFVWDSSKQSHSLGEDGLNNYHNEYESPPQLEQNKITGNDLTTLDNLLISYSARQKVYITKAERRKLSVSPRSYLNQNIGESTDYPGPYEVMNSPLAAEFKKWLKNLAETMYNQRNKTKPSMSHLLNAVVDYNRADGWGNWMRDNELMPKTNTYVGMPIRRRGMADWDDEDPVGSYRRMFR
jgi:hypothetical protein